MDRTIRNFSFFVLGVLIAWSALVGTAFAQASGPFSEYPPNRNPWNDASYRTSPGNVTGTSTGVDVYRPGYTTVATKNGTLQIPVGTNIGIDRGALARGIARAARLTPQGVAVGIAIDYGVTVGIKQCIEYGWCKTTDVTEPATGSYYRWNSTNYTSMQLACTDKLDTTIYKSWTGIREKGSAWPGTYNCSYTTSQGATAWTRDVDVSCASGSVFSLAEKACVKKTGTELKPSIPPYEDPGFLPWLKDSQGNTPGRGNPDLYNTGKNEGGDVENPANEPNLNVKWDAQPKSEPPVVRETQVQNADGTTSTRRETTTTTHQPNTQGTTNSNTSVTNTTTTTTTTVTIINNSTGTTTTTTESTTEQKPQDAFADTPFGEVPKLYEQKYPEGLAGAWNTHKPNLEGTQFWAGIKQMFPDFSGRGSCPSWSMAFNLGGAGNFGTMPINVPCWIFQAIGLIILTTAAFTARKIIF